MRTLGDKAFVFVLPFAVACGGDRPPDARATSSGGADSAVARPAETAAHFAVTDFRKLRWLGGKWRGTMPNGGSFHEAYRVVDDSTIAMQSFSDSTFRQASDSSAITLRDSVVASEGGSARWVATKLDSTGVRFAPDRGAGNSFTFTRDSTDHWTATLLWPNGRSVVYKMRRVGK